MGVEPGRDGLAHVLRLAVPGEGDEPDAGELAAGTDAPGRCAADWADGTAAFGAGDDGARRAALGYAEYYVGFLRDNGGKSADCLAR